MKTTYRFVFWHLLSLAVVFPLVAHGQENKTIETELLIVGGTESGCAAAIQAARMGVKSITLVNDIDWLGGQFSAEALGAIDENRAKGGTNDVPFPRNGLFKETIDRIEALNLEKYGNARPGNTVVKTSVCPADAAKIFQEMVEPYVKRGQLKIISGFYPISAEIAADGKTLVAVRFGPTSGSEESSTKKPATPFTVKAKITIDASDWGEAIKAAGAEYEFGPDLKEKYGEPNAPTDRKKYPITDMNPITWCVVIVETGGDQPIAKPARYDERNYLVSTSLTTEDWDAVGWGHKRLFGKNWPQPDHIYRSRRLLDHYGARLKVEQDKLMLNFPPQNYPLEHLPQHVIDALEKTETGAGQKNIVQLTRAQRQIIFDDAKQQALGFLYHLQTTVHDRMTEEQRQHSFRRFKLTDEFGTADHLPPKPYIRESLRLKAVYMMREQDTLKTDKAKDQFARDMYYDGVGSWQFEYDFHPTGRAFHPKEGAAGPWECVGKPGRGWGPYSDRAVLPMRSLVPEKIDGLIAAQKNLGFSSIVSSAVRLHDQSMMVGQAAGAAAAVCVRQGTAPRAISQRRDLLNEVRRGVCSRLDGGIPQTIWPFRDLAPKDEAFEAANLLAAGGFLPVSREEVDFRPNEPAADDWKSKVMEKSLSLKKFAADKKPAPPEGKLTRGEFAMRWWKEIQALPDVMMAMP